MVNQAAAARPPADDTCALFGVSCFSTDVVATTHGDSSVACDRARINSSRRRLTPLLACSFPSAKVVPRTLLPRLLWWAGFSFGLITCDPFADATVLAFVPLPPGKALRYREAAGVLDRYRVVGLRAGKLRFVDMYRNRDRRGALQVSVWTLADSDAIEWALEHEASFPDILGRSELQGRGSAYEDPRARAHPPQGPRHHLLLPRGAPLQR
ncbi:hypothetical protein PAHAL_5G274500 [Panicum hallii]|uniref:DUF1618 domain-containing protein n=1 Tax=Panicum hallii TaxID=206008 RepID=A0A2T8ILG4_9POAL|nr:hypothetical protein PAHAL_5G274500 [Panicum hallii]